MKNYIIPIIGVIIVTIFAYFYLVIPHNKCEELGGYNTGYYGKICVKDGLIIKIEDEK